MAAAFTPGQEDLARQRLAPRTHDRSEPPAPITTLLICLLLAAGTLALYWPVCHFPFLNYDDQVYVTENAHVQTGLNPQSVWWAFSNVEAAFWHPLTWLSHILDCQLYGLNSGGHHLTSLLLHVANTLLLFGVLSQMTRALWRSAFVAALFGWHPLHIESVAWIAERKDVLSTFFLLLTLWSYARYARHAQIKNQKSKIKIYYALSLFFFALGLMSKPMLVSLPFVLLLLDYWPLGRVSRNTEHGTRGAPPLHHSTTPLLRLLFEKLPFFLLSAAASVLVYWTEHQAGAIPTLAAVPLVFRIANAILSCASYLRKMVWPSDLAAFYPYPDSFRIWHAAVVGLLLAALTIFALRQHRWRFLTVGWLWYLVTLAPVSGLVQVGRHGMADRYTYIPLIGIFILIAWGGAETVGSALRSSKLSASRKETSPPAFPCFRRFPLFKFVSDFGFRISVFPLCGLVPLVALAGCLITSSRQLCYWQGDFGLFEHALAVTKKNTAAHCHVAWRLMSDGKIAQALEHYRTALQIDPSVEGVHYALGNWHRREGRLEDARAEYFAELQINPRAALPRNNLGLVLAALGKDNEALECFKKALAAKPDCVDAHNNLANMLDRKGKPDDAMAHYLAALRLLPKQSAAHRDLPRMLHLNLARLLDHQNHPAAAAEHLLLALRLEPNDPAALNRLGSVLARQGKTSEAIARYREALRLDPGLTAARNNLGIALARERKADEAAAEFTRALHDLTEKSPNSQLSTPASRPSPFSPLPSPFDPRPPVLGSASDEGGSTPNSQPSTINYQPSLADLHKNLAMTLSFQGKTVEAIAHYREALRLQPDLLDALNNLAWILATHKEPSLRNGAEALQLAERAATLSGTNDAAALDTLAAAYAEAGRFAEAVQTINKAAEAAAASGQKALAAEITARRALYQSNKPFRE